ncbi:MAG: tRNA (adenosine(37)-N6)-threonylcarbamoyltransferase complex ATPase subunit type 1 TsaE [Deltaproteobacteria bacterium]|nr:tRNA (adenosine(37)-N6)-threonylcarbamoyltransferase complex ATPase subunit type 1 TsaE [Deltaproteobacteria bacterium]MCX7952160.1 tRNA (adenosine(37)-N6)-threonylcarbamoyltransferase complex ATPase subunit type 1 TsaE [Deltaproteobacteria bacterium]
MQNGKLQSYFFYKKFTISTAILEDLRLLFFQKTIRRTVIALVGELGSGKTYFVKSLIGDDAESPSFVLRNEYQVVVNQSTFVVAHWDLYRLKNFPSELLFDDADTIFVEWADKNSETYFLLQPSFIVYVSSDHQYYVFSSSQA